MTHAHAQKLGIEQPYPQAPRHPAKHEVRFYVDDEFRALKLFRANYSALRYIEAFMNGDKFKKVNPTTMIYDTAQIHCSTLEEIMDHKDSAGESQFQLSSMTITEALSLRGLAPKRDMPEEPKRKKNKSRTKARASKKPSGLTSISDIAEQLSTHPRVLRKILRDHKFTKPEHGWAWGPSEAKKITKKLKKHL